MGNAQHSRQVVCLGSFHQLIAGRDKIRMTKGVIQPRDL